MTAGLMANDRSLPPNMKTLQFDIEEPSWTGLMTDCDLIHMRLMLGSIHNDAWKKVYRNALEYVQQELQIPFYQRTGR